MPYIRKAQFAAFALGMCNALIPSSASAEERDLSNWYITVSAGKMSPQEVKSKKYTDTYDGVDVSGRLILDYKDDNEYSIGLGYYLNPSTRLEFNYSGYEFDLNKIGVDLAVGSKSAEVRVSANQKATVESFLLSINKDFPSDHGWKPFIGAGIGLSNVSVNDTTLALGSAGEALSESLGTSTVLSGSDSTLFTYQFRGGIAKEISKNIDVFGELSYSGTEGFSAGSGSSKIKWEGIESIGYKVGARYRF